MSTTCTPTYAEVASHCYPLGNTPAVCLTQDIPPEEKVKILLLGCGDARHVLFTAYSDNKFGRELDITCCDHQPMVIGLIVLPCLFLQGLMNYVARNILLYTLLLDDTDGSNHIRIWNAYYHMRIDSETLKLIHLQAKKLRKLAASIEKWQTSKYGNVLRFCDRSTLQHVQETWARMMILDLNEAERNDYDEKFDGYLKLSVQYGGTERQKQVQTMLSSSRSIGPASFDLIQGISLLNSCYWFHGSADDYNSTLPTLQHSNPMFAFFACGSFLMNITSTPFYGFHLAAHLIPLSQNSNDSSLDRNLPRAAYRKLIDTMRQQFRSWSEAFQKRMNKGLTLRFFAGDAIAFCNTLEYKSTNKDELSANLYRNSYGFEPLVLDSKDYIYPEPNPREAPLYFDVIDTSNLVDHIGGINVLVAASPLLRKTMSSTIYTETIARLAGSYQELLRDMVCGDLPSVGALLRLSPIEYYTNASAISTMCESLVISGMEKAGPSSRNAMYNRLAWKRQITGSEKIHFHYIDMARLLQHIHEEMFRGEVPSRIFSDRTSETMRSHMAPTYTRASFAALLRWVQKTTLVEWDRVIPLLKDMLVDPSQPLNGAFQDELNVQIHNFGVNSLIIDEKEIQASIDSQVTRGFKAWKGVSPVLCVTIKVPRDRLDHFTKLFKHESLAIPFQCLLKSEDRTQQNYSVLQLSFGEIFTIGQRNTANFEVTVTEDEDAWDGDSSLLVSFYISTSWAIKNPAMTKVSLVIQHTIQTYKAFKDAFGIEKTLYETSLGNKKNVFITVLPPGQTNRPANPLPPNWKPAKRDPSLVLSAKLDPALPKIVAFVQTIRSVNQDERCFLWSGSGVDRRQISSCGIIFNTSPFDSRRYLDHFHRLRFPAPVSSTGKGFRIFRSSMRVEVDSPIEKYSNGNGPAKYMYPLFLRHKVPVLMNMPYLDLKQLLVVDTTDSQVLDWLDPHLKFQFSSRQRASMKLTAGPIGKDVRAGFKKTLHDMFLIYAGLKNKRKPAVFTLNSRTTGEGYFTIIVSSMRLDLANRTVVLDAAVLPGTKESKEKYSNIAPDIEPNRLIIETQELTLWHHAFPAWVERCRQWKHTEACEYRAEELIPLSARKGRSPKGISPFCSCGNGILPPDFITGVPKWYMVSKHAVRAAVSPCFAVEYVDPVYKPGDTKEQIVYLDPACLACKAFKSKEGDALLNCPKCLIAVYCSKQCQVADWVLHKNECIQVGPLDTGGS